jgi:hypothetical protein
MKLNRFHLSKLGEFLKQGITKNFWLKILSLVLALATYFALYDNTVKKSEKKENSDITSTFPIFTKSNSKRPSDETFRREQRQSELPKPQKEAEKNK